MVCAVVLVIAVSGSMIYYFAFAKPGHERAELEWEKEKQAEEDRKETAKKYEAEAEQKAEEQILQDCLDFAYNSYLDNFDNVEKEHTRLLDEAYKNYIENWNYQCKNLGKGPECALPDDTAETLNTRLDKDRDSAEAYLVWDMARVDKNYEEDRTECFKLYGPE